MRVSTRLVVFTSCLLVSATTTYAQSPVDPSGHWEGVVQVPDRPISIELDLVKKPSGELAGTFAQPEQGVRALPLSTVTAQDRSVRFVVKGSEQPSTFAGVVAADGQTMKGEVTLGEYVVPFELTRVGDARVAAPPKSPRIASTLEGTWNGAINGAMRVIVKMANQADGTSAGTIVSPDGSATEIPIAIAQMGKRVVLDVTAIGGRFEAELNVATGQLVGTWRQAASSLPLTLTRATQ